MRCQRLIFLVKSRFGLFIRSSFFELSSPSAEKEGEIRWSPPFLLDSTLLYQEWICDIGNIANFVSIGVKQPHSLTASMPWNNALSRKEPIYRPCSLETRKILHICQKSGELHTIQVQDYCEFRSMVRIIAYHHYPKSRLKLDFVTLSHVNGNLLGNRGVSRIK